jgi:surface antigen
MEQDEMKSISIAAAIAALSVLAPLSASQAFLIDPMGPKAGSVALTGKDLQAMRALVVELLERAKSGATRRWKNEKSGNSGTMRLIDIYQSKGLDCRRIRHTIKFKGFKDPRTFVVPYCKSDGQWRNALR